MNAPYCSTRPRGNMELTTVGNREEGEGGCDDSGQDFALWHRIDMLSQVGATR